jgi:hypothetical protein
MNSQPPRKKKAVTTGISSRNIVCDDKKSCGSLRQFAEYIISELCAIAHWPTRDSKRVLIYTGSTLKRTLSVKITKRFVAPFDSAVKWRRVARCSSLVASRV